MANEKRLIDANEAIRHLRGACVAKYPNTFMMGLFASADEIAKLPTVDAVEVDDMREFARDVAYQFGYYCHNGGRLHITHGGLSTLEWAFDIIGWENPHPVPECECEIDGCHEHATCGATTADGYKWMCGRHCRERRTDV
jgi:hypothetical protein